MFTGIIQGLGRLIGISPVAGERVLTVRPDFDWGEPLALGESIAVSGVCLTVTDITEPEFTAHVSHETLSRSVLARAGRGERVNLEKALRLSDRLGGHLVAGHVDGIGRILEIRPRDKSVILSFGMGQEPFPLPDRKRLHCRGRHQPDCQRRYGDRVHGEHHSAHPWRHHAGLQKGGGLC